MWELDNQIDWARRTDTFELWYTARRSNQSILKEITLNTNCNDWRWSWSSNTLATWCKEPTHWKRPWCWERSRAGERGNRGQDGWMASPTQWTWVWANSGRWSRTGKPGVGQSIESQWVRHDWGTQQQQQQRHSFLQLHGSHSTDFGRCKVERQFNIQSHFTDGTVNLNNIHNLKVESYVFCLFLFCFVLFFIILFISGCTGPSLLCKGFL